MRRLAKRLLIVVPGTIVLALAILYAALPSVSFLRTQNPKTSRFREIARAQSELKWAPLESFSPIFVCAVVESEDRSFFRHHGFDWDSLGKKIAQRLHGDFSRGGSTITQQLARNLFLTPDRTLFRKAREAVLTIKLERALSKPRILELYLNLVQFGPDLWGAGAAAEKYFHKRPAQIDPFEAAFLSAMLPAPTQPLSGKNLERADHTLRRVLWELKLHGIIDQSALDDGDRRMSRLSSDLASGVPLDRAVSPPVPVPPIASSLSLAFVLEHGCRLDGAVDEN